jgi:hypothetical protein
MDLRPWNCWRPDGTPYPGTLRLRERLEAVLAKAPEHPGALHLYIHLLEPTATHGSRRRRPTGCSG